MKHLIFVYGFLIVFSLNTAYGQITNNLSTNQAQSQYEKWIAPYRLNIVGRRHLTDKVSPKLLISVVIENTPPANNKIFFGPATVSYGSEISASGEVAYFSNGSRSRKGSCCSQIEKDDLKRLDQLLANLPNDNSFLPLNERRLLLQVAEGDKFTARVYDLANAPDEILEILRLTKSLIRSKVLSFAPETQWTAYDNHPLDGGLAVTADGQKIVSSALHKPIKIWDTNSHNLLQEISNSPNISYNGMTLSPDNSVAVIQAWTTINVVGTKRWDDFQELKSFTGEVSHGLSKPQFIENGKFLLLETSDPALRIYDTKTWKPLVTLPQIPAEAVRYYPASTKSPRAVYSLKDRQIILRDTLRQNNIATLDKAEISYVSYSPDESLVAIVTAVAGDDNEGAKYKIKIWNAESGKFVKELRPFEQDSCYSVEGIMWSPDNKYILAATKADVFNTARGISV